MTRTRELSAAKRAKKDEFYTDLDDIAEEVKHYRDHFRGKVVLCNCLSGIRATSSDALENDGDVPQSGDQLTRVHCHFLS